MLLLKDFHLQLSQISLWEQVIWKEASKLLDLPSAQLLPLLLVAKLLGKVESQGLLHHLLLLLHHRHLLAAASCLLARLQLGPCQLERCSLIQAQFRRTDWAVAFEC